MQRPRDHDCYRFIVRQNGWHVVLEALVVDVRAARALVHDEGECGGAVYVEEGAAQQEKVHPADVIELGARRFIAEASDAGNSLQAERDAPRVVVLDLLGSPAQGVYVLTV